MAWADRTKWNGLLRELFQPKPPSLRLRHEIDRGSFGAVYLAEWNGKLVAAKGIHELLKGEKEEEQEFMLRKFKKECSLLEAAKHPCIVTFYGAYYDEQTKEPLLVMERMSKNLRNYLKENKGKLELPQIVDISLSIAKALHYLHNLPEPIVHCDLNDKNVMLTESGVVKVGDMGESRRKMAQKRFIYTKGGAGAVIFMPPEALTETNGGIFRYNEKLDSFSAGVLMLEIATQTEPKVSMIGIGVTPEVQRRKQDLALLPDDHPMRDLILDCLEDDCNRRPDARKLQSQLVVANQAETLRQLEMKLMKVELEHSKTKELAVKTSSELQGAIKQMQKELKDLKLEQVKANSGNQEAIKWLQKEMEELRKAEKESERMTPKTKAQPSPPIPAQQTPRSPAIQVDSPPVQPAHDATLRQMVSSFYQNGLWNLLRGVPQDIKIYDQVTKHVLEVTMAMHKQAYKMLWGLVEAVLNEVHSAKAREVKSILINEFLPTFRLQSSSNEMEDFKEWFQIVHCGPEEPHPPADVKSILNTINAVLKIRNKGLEVQNPDYTALHGQLSTDLKANCQKQLEKNSMLKMHVPNNLPRLASQICEVVSAMLLHSSPIIPFTRLKAFFSAYHEPTRYAREDPNGRSVLVYRTPYVYYYHCGELKTVHRASVIFEIPAEKVPIIEAYEKGSTAALSHRTLPPLKSPSCTTKMLQNDSDSSYLAEVINFMTQTLPNVLDDENIPDKLDDLVWQQVQIVTMEMHKLACEELLHCVKSQWEANPMVRFILENEFFPNINLNASSLKDSYSGTSIHTTRSATPDADVVMVTSTMKNLHIQPRHHAQPVATEVTSVDGHQPNSTLAPKIKALERWFYNVHCGFLENLPPFDVRTSMPRMRSVLKAKEESLRKGIKLESEMLTEHCLEKLNEQSTLQYYIPNKLPELASKICSVVFAMLLHSSPIIPFTKQKKYLSEYHEPIRSAKQDPDGRSELVYRTPYLYYYHYGQRKQVRMASVSFAIPADPTRSLQRRKNLPKGQPVYTPKKPTALDVIQDINDDMFFFLHFINYLDDVLGEDDDRAWQNVQEITMAVHKLACGKLLTHLMPHIMKPSINLVLVEEFAPGVRPPVTSQSGEIFEAFKWWFCIVHCGHHNSIPKHDMKDSLKTMKAVLKVKEEWLQCLKQQGFDKLLDRLRHQLYPICFTKLKEVNVLKSNIEENKLIALAEKICSFVLAILLHSSPIIPLGKMPMAFDPAYYEPTRQGRRHLELRDHRALSLIYRTPYLYCYGCNGELRTVCKASVAFEIPPERTAYSLPSIPSAHCRHPLTYQVQTLFSYRDQKQLEREKSNKKITHFVAWYRLANKTATRMIQKTLKKLNEAEYSCLKISKPEEAIHDFSNTWAKRHTILQQDSNQFLTDDVRRTVQEYVSKDAQKHSLLMESEVSSVVDFIMSLLYSEKPCIPFGEKGVPFFKESYHISVDKSSPPKQQSSGATKLTQSTQQIKYYITPLILNPVEKVALLKAHVVLK